MTPDKVSRETSCGCWSWRPLFLQPLASKTVYTICYGILGIIQGMFFSYLTAIVSTLERQFGINTKEAAYIMSGNELSQTFFLLFMPFMIRVKRRPLWTAIGLAASGFGCFIMAVPHFIGTNFKENETVQMNRNSKNESLCLSAAENEQEETHYTADWVGISFLFMGIVLTGVGNSVFYSFGIAYLDDNTSKEKSPKLLGLTMCFRLVGPTIGYILASVCLKIFVNINVDEPGFTENDPRWIGAWWIGFPIIGILLLVFSFPLALFPQRLPKIGTDALKMAVELEESSQKTTFINMLKSLFRNKLFVFNLISTIFYLFAFVGFGTFMPKYMELQFHIKGSKSSLYVGAITTVPKAIGILLSGYVISRFKPSARFLCGWNVGIGLAYFFSLLLFSSIGCQKSVIHGHNSLACNKDCKCPVYQAYEPICFNDAKIDFYSPCLAGCKSITHTNKTNGRVTYANCSCSPHPYDEATSGLCAVEGCKIILRTFMILTLVLLVLGSTGRVGGMLVALRCINIHEKSISMALNVVFLSLLAMLPSPIFYGALIDTTCTLWNEVDGITTHCLTYDLDTLRILFMTTTAGIMLGGVIFDVGVFYYAKNLKLFDEANGKCNTESDNVEMRICRPLSINNTNSS